MRVTEAKAGRRVSRFLLRYGASLIIILAFVSYARGLAGEFVFDDIPLIQSDPFYADAGLADCWGRSFWRVELEQGLYRPLTLASYWLNIRIAGMYSPSFRIFNLILHAVCSVLVFKVFLALGLKRGAALFGAALFAVHPLHSEAVIPAYGRSELLCAMFMMTGLLAHLGSGRTAIVFTPLCLLAAFFSKEQGIMLLPICLLADTFLRHSPADKKLRVPGVFIKKGPVYLLMLLAAGIVMVSRYKATGRWVPVPGADPMVDNPLAMLPFFQRLPGALKIQGMALWKLLWPARLSHDYSYRQLMSLGPVFDFRLISSILLPCAAVYFLMRFFPRKKRIVLFCTGAYMVSALPVSNLIVLTGTIFGERLYYFPSVWFCAIASLPAYRCLHSYRKYTGLALLSGILLLAAGRIFIRCSDWDTRLSLAAAGVRTAPDSVKTWNNIAVQLAAEGRLENAVLACDRALIIKSDHKTALKNRAFYLIKLGRLKDAEKTLMQILKLGTEDEEVYNKLAGILATRGDYSNALHYFDISLEKNPDQTLILKAVRDVKNELQAENE